MASSTTQPHPTVPPQPKRRIDLTSTKVLGSAGAAVTSAVGSGLFGATGTIAGAAVGSVISTVAGAVYERSLQNAQEKLRETTVVVRKVPGRSGYPGALPKDLPEVEAGAERQDAGATQAIHPPDVTTAMPVIQLPVAEHGDPATAVLGGPGDDEPDDEKPVLAGFGRRKLLVLAAVMLTGFVIALGGMTLVEKVLGHQLNGDTGTSVGTVTGTSSSTSNDDEDTRPAEQEPTATPTEEPTASPEATESADPDATTSPDASEPATGEPSETGDPSQSEAPEPTQDAGTDGDTSQGSGSGSGSGSGAGAAPAPTADAAND